MRKTDHLWLLLTPLFFNFYTKQLKSDVRLCAEGLSVSCVSCCWAVCWAGLRFNLVSVSFSSQAVAAASTGRRLCVKLVCPQLCSHPLCCLPGLPPTCPLSPHPAFTTYTFPVSPASTHMLHICPEGPFRTLSVAPIIPLVAGNGDTEAADFQTERPFSPLYAWSLSPNRHLLFINRSATLFMSCCSSFCASNVFFMWYHDGKLIRFIALFCFLRTPPQTPRILKIIISRPNLKRVITDL